MRKALIFAALCIASWSLIPVVAKVTTQDITPLQFLLLSNVLSAFVCGAVALKRAPSFAGLFAEARGNLLRTALPGFLGCYLFYLCLYHGYAVGDGMAVLVVQYLWPVLIVLLAPLVTRERIGPVGLIAVLLGFAGSAVVATKGNFTALPAQAQTDPLTGHTHTVRDSRISSISWNRPSIPQTTIGRPGRAATTASSTERTPTALVG